MILLAQDRLSIGSAQGGVPLTVTLNAQGFGSIEGELIEENVANLLKR